MKATEKYVRIGRGYPRKRMAWTNAPWFSGTLKSKQTVELLEKLRANKYHDVSWILQPNKNYKKSGSGEEPPYYLVITYWGTEEESK